MYSMKTRAGSCEACEHGNKVELGEVNMLKRIYSTVLYSYFNTMMQAKCSLMLKVWLLQIISIIILLTFE
jgi:hypothetical protein